MPLSGIPAARGQLRAPHLGSSFRRPGRPRAARAAKQLTPHLIGLSPPAGRPARPGARASWPAGRHSSHGRRLAAPPLAALARGARRATVSAARVSLPAVRVMCRVVVSHMFGRRLRVFISFHHVVGVTSCLSFICFDRVEPS